MTLTPRFQFGAIKGVVSASFSLSRGTSPSVCSVTIPWGLPGVFVDRVPRPMIWSDGARQVVFPDCVVNDLSPTIGDDGSQYVVLSILDRRWRWRFSQISGSYNVRSGGVILTETRKTVRELVELCLKELGEKNFDISRMPEDTFPHVDWDMTPVDAALDDLCRLMNCHVSLTENNRVVIMPEGAGREIPNFPSSSQGMAFDFGIVPGKVGIASAPAKWQLEFDLMAVGLEVDGTIKPIWELSYTPIKEETWEQTWEFSEYPYLNVKRRCRKLAQETVFRWYKILPPKWVQDDAATGKAKVKTSGDALTKLPGTNEEIYSVRQFFPLLDHQLDYERVSEDQRQKLSAGKVKETLRARKPPQVIGYFYDGGGLGSDNWENPSRDDSDVLEADQHLIYPGSFQIDDERGLVIFADPVYRFVWAKGYPARKVEANIRLRVAANFHHADTRAAYRLEKKRPILGAPDPRLVAWQSREDIVPEYVSRYNWEEEKLEYFPKDGNLSEVNKQLDYYLTNAVKKYETKTPANATFPFLVPWSPDGKIAQVVYEISGQGFLTTSIYKQREEITSIASYEERRDAVQQFATMQKLARLAGAQDDKKGSK